MICVTNGPVPELERIAAPAPVTVHCDVGGLWFPNSNGNLNCFSALQKWLEAAHITFLAHASVIIEPRLRPSTKVEQAPNIPKNGIFKSLKPKLEEIHWFNKSPAKQYSISVIEIPDFAIAILTVSLIILLSDFSQVFSPQNSSSKHWSKYLARGPSASFGPTIEATSVITGGVSNFIVWFPNFCIQTSIRAIML